jgi:hypothetical protein
MSPKVRRQGLCACALRDRHLDGGLTGDLESEPKIVGYLSRISPVENLSLFHRIFVGARTVRWWHQGLARGGASMSGGSYVTTRGHTPEYII